MPRHPERMPADTSSSPDSPAYVSEIAAIVGEDARHTPLQRLIVGKEITHPATLASALTASLVTVARASLVVTEPIQIDRAKKITIRVTYTPGENNAQLILYPQITLGETPEVFDFIPSFGDALTPLNVTANPLTLVRECVGDYAEYPFIAFTTVAATPVVRTFPIDDYPAMNALRFALRDTAQETAGTATIIVVQE